MKINNQAAVPTAEEVNVHVLEKIRERLLAYRHNSVPFVVAARFVDYEKEHYSIGLHARIESVFESVYRGWVQ